MTTPKIGRLADAKHSTVMLELIKAMQSPVAIPLIDALLEDKKAQFRQVQAVKAAAEAAVARDIHLERAKRRFRR